MLYYYQLFMCANFTFLHLFTNGVFKMDEIEKKKKETDFRPILTPSPWLLHNAYLFRVQWHVPFGLTRDQHHFL